MVGRTGAGKTTLFSAILRLTELDSGQILIDDIDVSKVELNNLRSNVAVIPQDPVLFQVSFFPKNEFWACISVYRNRKCKIIYFFRAQFDTISIRLNNMMTMLFGQ